MRFSLDTDEFGRLACRLEDEQEQRAVFGAEPQVALADLSAALDALERDGYGECFWPVSAGEYRWVFRREGEKLRLAVLWVRSVAIGFQHVYWGEVALEPFVARVREEIGRMQVAAGSQASR